MAKVPVQIVVCNIVAVTSHQVVQDANFELGGSYVPKKKPRPLVPKCTLVVQPSDGLSIYSVNTSTYDDRCIVVREEASSMCQHHLCKQNRAIHINSQKVASFSCQHLESTRDCTTPLQTFNGISDEVISSYLCDDETKKTLAEVANASKAQSFPVVVHVSPTMYCIFGMATTNNTVGYCHVKVTEKEIKCCSKDCKGMLKSKQQKSRKVCTHIHLLLALGIFTHNECVSADLRPPIVTDSSLTTIDRSGSKSRKATMGLKMKLKLPYVIPKPIIQAAGKMDFSVWPEQFEPDQTLCDLCKSPLGQSKPHPNQRGRSIIMTNGCPFKTVKMLVKDCSCCFAMHQVFLYTLGLFNISDKVLVALEILLEFRELFKRGVPISVAMKSKLALMVQKVEAITECNMDSGVCGICSTVGEVYFGDGNEKIAAALARLITHHYKI
ncbi:uncharacterized protein LOC114516136 isoform X2 [Dendronephthya gigantea]|uniref:uncharacterized protein LOC114516136 isoform X2 n=1 Tax=Dendronephthya gigantea TaxID=151771 RepID=UPI00106BADA8|nr:uncharacterized protein LOC114516136 isoform X2 [Dendronephthya gigantea]